MIISVYPDQFNESGFCLDRLEVILDRIIPSNILLHLLPFQLSCGDGGFAIKDWYAVDPTFGSWKNIQRLSAKYRVILDGIFNHIGTESRLFQGFIQEPEKFKNYFYVNQNNGR